MKVSKSGFLLVLNRCAGIYGYVYSLAVPGSIEITKEHRDEVVVEGWLDRKATH